jgi:TetR/AcrR family transcriptional regulator, mexJK operon transcriptional repressor
MRIEEGRTARKRGAIVEAARALFLRRGYAGTSMDDVAAAAAVSKQTVYKNFTDKQRLFTEVITGDIARTEQQGATLPDGVGDAAGLDAALREFARRHLADVLHPDLVRMRRIVVGEAERFPELARTWYASAIEPAHAAFAAWFADLARRGLLTVDDPLLAAEHFHWLVLSIPMNRAMFLGLDEPFPAEDLQRWADEGVRVFLAAYATAPDGVRRPPQP